MLTFLLAQAAALSFAQLQAMPPAAAGEAILRDHPHGPIETFETPANGMMPAGMIEAQLVEQPRANGSGCARRRWTVTFRAAPGAEIGSAKTDSQYSLWEIAPSPAGTCPSGQYVHLNPGVSIDQGWTTLARLKAVIADTDRSQLQCSDSTSSGLCDGDKAIRSALRGLTPWAITLEAGDALIWLGAPGQVVTEVRFGANDPAEVRITRRVPAPF